MVYMEIEKGEYISTITIKTYAAEHDPECRTNKTKLVINNDIITKLIKKWEKK